MSGDDKLLQCYNRGCGQKYDPTDNKEDACRHHPGVPVFHDAYKGWSCCSKKCIDFTEFLNIQGCTVTKHSNVKPPEPEKPKQQEIPDKDVIEVKPIVAPSMKRPPFGSPMTLMKPEIAPSLKSQLSLIEQPQNGDKTDNNEIAIGANCKNGGCTVSYQGTESNNLICLHHPGVPIFHEGLKYWSCCQRKTTDFNSFLSQEGCKEGSHVWLKDTDIDDTKAQCRWDYHQTGPHMVLSIYAKQYSPSKSIIKLNPVRLYANLVFPQQNYANFELDIELGGVIDVSASTVTMYGTKVEVKLKKAEAGSWSKLETKIIKNTEPPKKETLENLTPQLDAVDLSSL